MKRIAASLLPALLLLAASSLCAPDRAYAQDCAPPRYVTGVPMTPDATNTMMVPVTINGVPERMMLDTGGVVSEISRATQDTFNLPEQESRQQIFDIRGSVSRTVAKVDALGLGGLDLTGVKLQINTDPVFGPAFAGLISNDLLAPYDVDLDFGSNRLNLFTPGRCEGSRVYWPAKAIAVVPFDYTGSHIALRVMLDGHLLSAVLDTGASITTLSLDAAARLYGLTLDSPRMALSQQGAGNDSNTKIYTHTFSQMTFEGVKVTHPLVMIVPVRLNGADSRSNPGRWNPRRWRNRPPDLIIGMEVLRTLHIYIAFHERRLYITRADQAAAHLLPAEDPPALSPPAISAIQP